MRPALRKHLLFCPRLDSYLRLVPTSKHRLLIIYRSVGFSSYDQIFLFLNSFEPGFLNYQRLKCGPHHLYNNKISVSTMTISFTFSSLIEGTIPTRVVRTTYSRNNLFFLCPEVFFSCVLKDVIWILYYSGRISREE